MSDPNDFEVTLNAFAEQAKEAWSERSTEERTTFENEISSSGSATAAKPIEPPVNDDLLKRMQERAALSGGFAPRALLAGLPVDDPNPLLDALAAEFRPHVGWRPMALDPSGAAARIRAGGADAIGPSC